MVGGSCVAPTTPVAPNARVQLDLNDYLSTATTAVSLNVTVTRTAAAGFLTVWPCDQPQPDTSNLNFAAGDTRANLVVAKIAADGTVCMNATAGTDLIADVTGTYEFGGGVLSRSVTPVRLLDTRDAIGVPSRTKIPAGGIVTLQVAGIGAVPNDAGAATLNVTAVEPDAGGNPHGMAVRPTAPGCLESELRSGQNSSEPRHGQALEHWDRVFLHVGARLTSSPTSGPGSGRPARPGSSSSIRAGYSTPATASVRLARSWLQMACWCSRFQAARACAATPRPS